MDAARITTLLAPFLGENDLDQTVVANISMYIDILQRWNQRVNLSAIRDPEQIVTRHFGESLFAARHLFPRSTHVGTATLGCPAQQSSAATIRGIGSPEVRQESEASAPTTLADVGSGAGFPGIPIKLWATAISLTLIESSHKKAAFLREIVRVLTLTDTNIQNTRAETLTPNAFDVVTLRAVERFDKVLPIAARLLKPGATLALLIGAAQFPQATTCLQDYSFAAPIPIPKSESRILAIAQSPRAIQEPR